MAAIARTPRSTTLVTVWRCGAMGVGLVFCIAPSAGSAAILTWDLAIRKELKEQAAADQAAWKARWPLGYNPAASVVMLPTTPLSPTKVEECTKYQEKSHAIVKDVALHHGACLNATASTRHPYAWTDLERPECSNPACDSLHRAMYRLGGKADTGYAKCMEAVRRHQSREGERGSSGQR